MKTYEVRMDTFADPAKNTETVCADLLEIGERCYVFSLEGELGTRPVIVASYPTHRVVSVRLVTSSESVDTLRSVGMAE